MKKLTGIFAMVACAVLAGCSTWQPTTQRVKIACSEPDAVLDVSGIKYRGSVELDARRNKDLLLSCAKPGFLTAGKTVRTSMSGTGKADAVGGLILLVPAIGLVTPGAWDLDESDITIPMLKERPGEAALQPPPPPYQ